MPETARAPGLAYVALAVDDPQRTAAVFEQDLGLPGRELRVADRRVPAVGAGATVLVFFRAGDPFLGADAPRGVHHVAFAAADPRAAARACGLAASGVAGDGLDGRTQVALARDATCGVRVRFTEALEPSRGASAMVERIDHLGVASTDNRAARRVFVDRLGCVYESEQTDSEVETLSESFTSDTYGTVFHSRAPRLAGSMRVTFITAGDCELEFLQDLTTGVTADAARHDAAGNTRGDRSAIARYVASRGAGLHHIAFKTPDIAAALASLGAAGHRMIDREGRPGSRRARIGFVHPSALGGVLAHFVEREPVVP